MKVRINGGFVGQLVTGQQRYAHEITRRLLRRPGVDIVQPPWPLGPVATWLWCQGPNCRAPADGALLSLTSRAPLAAARHVLTVHDLFPLTNPEWYSRSYAKSHAWALRTQLKTARAVVCVSPQTQELVNNLAPTLPTTVVPNGVEVDDAAPTTPLHPRPYLLSVGSVDPRKNTATLIAAFETLTPEERQDVDLVLVGGANSAVFRASFVGQGSRNVHHVGYVDDADLERWYRGALGLVMPSLAEGFGLPLIEAAARGTPVVASDLSVFRWICGEAARYVDPVSTESVKAGLVDLLNRHGEYASKAASTAESFKQRFSWDNSAAELASFLTQVAG